jgi:predicted HicB family RNase H-like nuclease
MPRKNQELRPVMTRIPEELRRQLERAAARAGRSMNAEIISRLERSFTELQVRLSEGLERRLEQAARDHNWSINTEIVDRLEVSSQREVQEEMIRRAVREGLAAGQSFDEEQARRAQRFDEEQARRAADKEEKPK